jgi:DNA-binding MurR/RpiR family transcriptional regulator
MYADDLLVASSMAASFVDSLVAPMSLCNALIAAVGLRKKDEVSKTFERLEKIWDEYGVYEKSGVKNDAE